MLHGLMQSTTGPASTSIMGNWYGYTNRGYIFGLWACNQYIGNIVAALLIYTVLKSNEITWIFALAIPAAASCIAGFVCLLLLPEHPEQVPGLEKFRSHGLLKDISRSVIRDEVSVILHCIRFIIVEYNGNNNCMILLFYTFTSHIHLSYFL